jgi:hypothetical protein
MPRGDKSSYSSKQKRQAKHIEDSEKKEGKPSTTAKRIAWATVNKSTGGGAKKVGKKVIKKKATPQKKLSANKAPKVNPHKKKAVKKS